MKEPLVSNAADPTQVSRARKTEGTKRSLEVADFIMLMNTQYGRRFVLRLLDITGFQKTSFTGNSHTFFNEGRRSIGLEVWADLQECPDLYMQMITEQREERN